MEEDVYGLAFFEQLWGTDKSFFQRKLLKGAIVHKVVASAVLVQKLVRPALYARDVYFDACVESIVDDFACCKAFELGTHKGTTFARLYVLKLNNGVKILVKLDAQSVSEVTGIGHVVGL